METIGTPLLIINFQFTTLVPLFIHIYFSLFHINSFMKARLKRMLRDNRVQNN